MVQHDDAFAECGVGNPDAGVQIAPRPDARPPLQDHVWMNHRVGAHFHIHIDVGGCRIDDRDARRHQFLILALSHHDPCFRQLGLAVDAADFPRVHGHRLDLQPLRAVRLQDGRQVPFAFPARRVDPAERGEERSDVEHVDAAIDLVDCPLRVGGVCLLHDAFEPAAVPDDATVAVGPLDLGGQHRGDRTRALVGFDRRRDRPGMNKRRITREDDDAASRTPQCRLRLEQRVRGSELRFLADESEPVAGAVERRPHRFGAVAHDQYRRGRFQWVGRAQHMLNQRTAGEPVQHFRPHRLHPCPAPRCENDDVPVRRIDGRHPSPSG